MSRSHRRGGVRLTVNQWLLLAVVALLVGCIAAFFLRFFRPPEQKLEEPELPALSDEELSDQEREELEALRSHLERKDNFYTILVSGVDDGNGGSDTNILLAVDTQAGYIHGVSIPRDTKAVINGKNRKINAAYSIGGMDLLAQTISEQLGIPVDYTVLVDLQGFVALVNAIDGVDFYVPLDMDYDDPIQNLSIHFSKGMQHLNGQQALEVVRFRHNNDGTGYGSEDIGRMQTQQNFLKAVAQQTLRVDNLDKINEFVRIFNTYVETDLTLGNLAWLGTQAIQIGAENISFSTLPGQWIDPYIYLDAAATLEVVNQSINPYVEDRTPEDLQIPS